MPPARISLPNAPKDSSNNGLLSPSWQTTQRARSTGGRSSYSQGSLISRRDKLINNADKLKKKVLSTWRKLTPLQRVLVSVAFVFLNVLGVLFLVYNEKIFGWLQPFADKWKNTTGGWTILWALTFMTAFPPMIGYSTCGTTAGFVYGVWEGWLILATASVAGSFCSFIVSRTLLRQYVERMVANDKRFAALTLTLKHDGLKLLCMIRLCPLPYSFSNGAMSTFPTVQPGMYALATALISPKLFIHAFIGSRLAAIARSGEKMSAGARAVNWISIVTGMLIGTFTGLYIYRKTMARARELEAEEVQGVQDSARRAEPLARQFSDDPEAQAAAETLARDEDGLDFFDDDDDDDANPVSSDYRDGHSDGADVFGQGDGDEDADAIGLHDQKKESLHH